jgi:uncharacterized protein YjbJ (UPF0337 family)
MIGSRYAAFQAFSSACQQGPLNMNEDQVKGVAKIVAGIVQEETGNLIGSSEQVVRGLTRQVAGKAQKGHGDVMETIKDFNKDHPNMNTEYVAKMETQLKKWDADVDALAAEGEKASAAARAAYHEGIKNLRVSRDAAQKTFQEIRVASESAGAQMQAGMKTAWETMQKALEKVSSDLRK